MHSVRFGSFLVGVASLVAAGWSQSATAFTPNALILNEANTVSGSKFLDGGNVDTSFGRVEGNGQNWLEFLVVQGDAKQGGGFTNTLDLRGWTINWSYDKDNLHQSFGSGAIQFSQDPLWAAVPRGTMLTMSEWSDAWYDSGSLRAGGINGLGHLRGLAYNSGSYSHLGATSPGQDPKLLATDTSWNPAANDDWRIHVFAGEQNPNTTFKYFNFSGSITDTSGAHAIGTDDGGLFTANNDNWQYTIRDAQSNVIQGPIGEQDTGLGSSWRVSSTEIVRLENFDATTQPTQANYLGATIFDYADGSASSFGGPNSWSQGAGHQGLAGLRDWLQMGDADLDGVVTGADYVIWRKHLNSPGGWRDGDFSGNGTVDMADYDIWRTNFGVAPPGSGAGLAEATVPEPQTFVLLALAAISLASAGKRKRTLTRGR